MASISGSIPLFLQTEPVNLVYNSLELTLNASSSGVSGVFGGIPLYTYSDASGNIKTGGMNLYLEGATVGSYSGNLNLFVEGTNYKINGSIDLTAWNATSGVNNSLTLYVKGSGVTSGYLPYEKGMNLFIKRPVSDVIPLYLRGEGTPINSGITLYTNSNYESSGVVPLSIPVVVVPIVGSMELFSSGF